jgi:sialate O-acetylesterase
MTGGYIEMDVQLRLPRLVSDGMVLQRNAKIKIWGWAKPGGTVTLHFLGQAYRSMVSEEGRWEIAITTQQAGGPHDMKIMTGDEKESILLSNILIGDVWLCSGQSNMEMRMEALTEVYPEDIKGSDNSLIRQFMVPMVYNFSGPQLDVDAGSWQSANPDNILSFTATGYFFALELFRRYQVPIGLINASLGGSPAEAWLSEDALLQFPGYLEAARRFRDTKYVEEILEKDISLREEWCRNITQQDIGLMEPEKSFYTTEYDASDWDEMKVPSYWEEEGIGSFNGVVWFRKVINLTAQMAEQKAVLRMGNILDEDTVYINGKEVGTLPMQYIPRRYEVPEGVLKEGANIIVVRVVNYSGKGGFYKEKPYCLEFERDNIDLIGKWQYRIGAKCAPLPEPTFVQWQPSGLYNAMIAPVIFYPIKGVLWYQGETNTRKPEEYESLLKALIQNWRTKWGEDVPFLYVQLPNFEEAKSEPIQSNWAILREGQRRTLEVPGTGMAVTIDIGEWNDIHPVNKKEVGKRLSLVAQKVAYGDETIVSSGPMIGSAIRQNNKIRLIFSEVGSGLTTKDGRKPGHFAVAGPDQRFFWAETEIDGDCVLVWSDRIPEPVYIRYAWAENPVGANLYNKEGLPASPFCYEVV